MKFIPHDYQKYAIDYIENHEITALLLEMGLGRKNLHHTDRY